MYCIYFTILVLGLFFSILVIHVVLPTKSAQLVQYYCTGKISETTINPGIFVKITLARKKKREIMIGPTFPEICVLIDDVVRLFSRDITAFLYCCVKYLGSFGDVKCSPGSAAQFLGVSNIGIKSNFKAIRR